MVSAFMLMPLLRNSEMLIQFTIVALAGRFSNCLRNCDNVILTFFLTALAVIAFRNRIICAFAWFIAAGLILWLPPRISGFSAAIAVLPMILTLTGAAAFVLYYARRANAQNSTFEATCAINLGYRHAFGDFL
jgi:hypothetical protein